MYYANKPNKVSKKQKSNLIKFASLAVLGSTLAACGNTATEGDDIFLATNLADIIDGLGGRDTVSYINSAALVNINLLTDTYSGGDAQGDDLTNIENIIGSALSDKITGNNLANIIDGGAGNDTLFGLLGDDVINSGDGDDYIDAGAGADIIDGGNGNDVLYGQDGDDIIDGSAGDDVLYGQDGDDIMNGGAGSDLIDGGAGADNINGGLGDDGLFGFGGDDIIDGGAGINDINGGAGEDILFIGSGAVVYTIDKPNNKIGITNATGTNNITSIETLNFGVSTIDIQNIWDNLAAVEQNKFSDNEADFLTWLGDDAGYNYEGL